MASATHIQISQQSSLIPSINNMDLSDGSKSDADPGNVSQLVNMDEAIHLATIFKHGLKVLNEKQPDFDPSHAFTPDEILALPVDEVRIPDALHDLPRRKSARSALANAIAGVVYPELGGALSAIIRYDAERVKLRAWAALQRKHDILTATKRNGHSRFGMNGGAMPGVHAPIWSSRITAQGPWEPDKFTISNNGVQALPMPVTVAQEADLAPFLGHLAHGGSHELGDGSLGVELDDGKGEPFYGTKGAEFRKGVVYEDGRMDLCKMVVGPDHIGRLMNSLRTNDFVRHFLLGNNIIGPVGAKEIANFIEDFPDRMDTWYLAGNCIDGPSFQILVDALIESPAVTNIWLKRNPLGRNAALDVYRLVTGVKNLRTLDLDQTELGDSGIAELFTQLAAYKDDSGRKLSLEHIYMNGDGIGEHGAKAIASFLESPHCGLTSLYMSCNPLGDAGAAALAAAVSKTPQLIRLSLQSTGLTSNGAAVFCNALKTHPGIQLLDIGQAFATQDLGQAYNYIEDSAVEALCDMLRTNKSLAYLNLGHCPISPPALRTVGEAVAESTLLFYSAQSILPDPELKRHSFVPSSHATLPDMNGPSKEQQMIEKAIHKRLEANVKVRHGEDMTYGQFLEDEKRWIVNDKSDVRKIDSVYRNRDMGLARRRLMTLVKDWDAGDDTLERVMNAQGPFCTKRQH
jgi:NLR family CARD domain-containing protein 3